MMALLRKDRPWIVALLVAGTIALAAAIGERGGFEAFVVGAWRLEVLFHAAWICGLVLGIVAACFDEVLGTREYLRQRPVSRQQLLRARLVGCGLVLLGWFVLAPVCAWLWFVAFGDGWQFTRLLQLGQILGSLLPAVTACALGFAAASLPTTWWRRLLALAASFLAGFAVIWQLSTARGQTDVAVFWVAHLLFAAACVAVVIVAARSDADADRPWPSRLRLSVGGALALAVALMWAATARETQVACLYSLHRAYPQVVRQGDTVALARRRDDGSWQVANADHVPTATVLPPAQGEARWIGPEDLPWQYEFDAPRWGPATQRAGGFRIGVVYLASDGEAWVREWGQGVARIGKGPEARRFAPGSRLCDMDELILVHDEKANELWRYEPGRRCFVTLALPDDDQFEDFDQVRLDVEGDAAIRERLQILTEDRFRSVNFVRGTRRSYVVRDGKLVTIEGLHERGRRVASTDDEQTVGVQDPIAFAVDLPAMGEAPAFHHEFSPRTAMERLAAGAAMVWSLVRPPVLQGSAHVLPATKRPPCWFDPLVAGGRRSWLVLAGIALAAAGAWRLRRRLRAFTAPASTIRFWTIATLLGGPITIALCLVFERPRAYARRALPGPFPAPRITTATSLGETVA